MKNNANNSRKRSRWRNLLFGSVATVLCVALVFGALELTCRALYLREGSLDWLQWHPTRLYTNNPDLPDVFWDTEWNVNPRGFRGPEPGEKTKPRILCLGDSSTFGYKVSYESCYPRQIEKRLPQYEVINAGTFGYSSYQGRMVFEEVHEKLDVDVVTLAFGFNDRRYVMRPDLHDGKEAFDLLYRQYSIHSLFSNSRFYQVLMHNNMTNRLRKHPPVLTLVPRVNTLQYRENLESVIQACQAKGIKPVLIYTGEHPALHEKVHEGIDHLDRKEYEEAVQCFQEAREGEGEDAQVLAAYYLALTLQTLGRFEEADAMQYDYPFSYYFPGVNPIRTSHSYLRALHELSQEYGVPVVIYRELIGDDSNFYIDECHPSEAGYAILAQAVAEAIVGKAVVSDE